MNHWEHSFEFQSSKSFQTESHSMLLGVFKVVLVVFCRASSRLLRRGGSILTMPPLSETLSALT